MKTDEALWRKIHEEKPGSAAYNQALEELWDRYRNLIRKKARTYFLVGGDSEDLIQEGMIGLYKAIMDYDATKGFFGSFASMCIERQIRTAVKMSIREKHQPLNQALSYLQIITDEEGGETQLIEMIPDQRVLSPEQTVVGEAERINLLETLKKKLSPMESRFLDLYLSGKGYQEIAKEMDISVKSADNALQRIRRKASVLISNGNSLAGSET